MATPSRRIPIQNLYYLLCYAWDELPLVADVEVSAQAFRNLPDLLARVILNGTQALLRRGLPGDYVREESVYAGIKGKLLWNESVRQQTLPRQRTVCAYDVFSTNTLPNQLVKATLERLAQTQDIDTAMREEAAQLLASFEGIDSAVKRFEEARRHRLAPAYRLLLSVGELFHQQLLPIEETGTYRFQSFEGNEVQMGYLFEAFVRNFCRRELPRYRVRREYIAWQFSASDTDRGYLPRMETDLSLEDDRRKLLVDAKFYSQTLQARYDARKLHAPHLYQLFAYLKNHASNKPCEGLLLYPVVTDSLSLTYYDERHRIRVETLNLAQDWRSIHADLIRILTAD